jgi:hypothetical protein
MTSHEFARYLLEKTPDIKICVNGWGSDEGYAPFEADGASAHKDKDGNITAIYIGYYDCDNEWCLTEKRL